MSQVGRGAGTDPNTGGGPAALPLPHALLALAVTAVWGSNFVVMKVGLDQFPPLLFAFLRFLFVLLPAVLFVRPPKAPWRHLALYGVLVGVGQFGLLFIAVDQGLSPGLASLVVQCQVFFTMGLAVLVARERVAPYQWLAVGLAAAGIVLIALRGGGDATPIGLGLALAAAFCWGCSNLVVKASPGANMLAYVVWGSISCVPPLLALTLLLEGPSDDLAALRRADLGSWLAVGWQAAGNTLFGFAAWSWLLARHPAGTVAPLSLLVPVFGMAASAIVLHEALPAWKLIAAALVICGLALNFLWPRLSRLAMRGPPA
jgi:O-acetylserine/cysteine efflux transporter